MRAHVLAVAAASLMIAATAAATEPVTIHIAWITSPPMLSPVLFEQPRVATHLDKTYRVEAIHFQGGPPIVTALAVGEVDIASISFSLVSTAVVNAGMSDLRIIADEFQDGGGDGFSSPYLVLKDGPIRTVEDLKGKIVATNGIGSAIDMAMRFMLRQHGLEDRRDYSSVEVGFPNMRAMLADHKVDLIMVGANYANDPQTERMARTLFTMRDSFKGPAGQMWAARAGFIEKNRPAMVDFIEDALRGLHWYLDPANREAALAILSKFSKQSPERLSWVFSKNDFYHDPNGMPNIAATQHDIALQRELGFLKTDFDVTHYVDLSLVKEAGARLRPD
jgi:NitT/TauT family transport system substrate-binding protein